jgi:hypothetical protein
MLAEPGERIVDVVYGKHDAQVAESVHWGVSVIGDHRRRDKSRELKPAVAVWRAHHGDFNTLVTQSSDAPCPRAFCCGSPFELQAELSKKRDSGIEGFHHDADVVHSSKRHASILLGGSAPPRHLWVLVALGRASAAATRALYDATAPVLQPWLPPLKSRADVGRRLFLARSRTAAPDELLRRALPQTSNSGAAAPRVRGETRPLSPHPLYPGDEPPPEERQAMSPPDRMWGAMRRCCGHRSGSEGRRRARPTGR